MMFSLLLSVSAPALADSGVRSARQWSDGQVSDVLQWSAEVQDLQDQADAQRDLGASRCLAPLAGDLKRMERQGAQLAERYVAATRDQSGYAQSVAQQELSMLHSEAYQRYSAAWSCGSFESPRGGLDLGGMGVGGTARDLYWRAEDGVYLGPGHLSAGLYAEGGWSDNPLQQSAGSDASTYWALTPRSDLTASLPRSVVLDLGGQVRLSRYQSAPERNEVGTWEGHASLYRLDYGAGGGLTAASAREVNRVTPWPDIPAPYTHAEHRALAHLNHLGGNHWVELRGGLAQESWQGAGLDRQRRSAPATLDLVYGGGTEGFMVRGAGERLAWTGDGAPMSEGTLARVEGGLRASRLESHYGVAWVHNADTGALERGWVGSTRLEIPVRMVTVQGFHERDFGDHWLAPTAITHSAGGKAWLWWRGFNPHLHASWGVEQPGDLRMRSVQSEAGLRYAPVQGFAIDLSGAYTDREQVAGADLGALDFDEARVMLTLELF